MEKYPSVKEWMAWQKLPANERDKINQKWNAYYLAVRKTKAYRRFAKMRQYWKQGNMEAVKQWARKAREQLKNRDWELKEPSEKGEFELSTNPNTRKYNSVLTAIKNEGYDEKYQEAVSVFQS